MQAALPGCGGLPILHRFIRYVPVRMALQIYRLFVMRRRCILTYGYQILAFRVHGLFEQMLEVFPHSWRFEEGYMHPGDEPGLGISFDEKLAAKYPYDPAYLPVARLEDGTLWNW